MNKQKRLVLGIIVVAVLLMGVGYAAITNVELTINGRASSTASQENFRVYFTGENTVKSDTTENNIDVTIKENKLEAILNISGLVNKDDEKYAILEIENGSNDIDAKSVTVASEAGSDIIEITSTMCNHEGTPIDNYEVLCGAKTYVKVTAKLLKTPTEDVSTAITATITAEPKEVK